MMHNPVYRNLFSVNYQTSDVIYKMQHKNGVCVTRTDDSSDFVLGLGINSKTQRGDVSDRGSAVGGEGCFVAAVSCLSRSTRTLGETNR